MSETGGQLWPPEKTDRAADEEREKLTDSGRPADEDAYYYDTRTGEVLKGLGHSWSHRMGPYSTPEEAADALQKARARSQAWDEDDKQWEQGK